MDQPKQERVCRHCGDLESMHCVFEPAAIPAGCVCDAESWWPDNPAPICDEYVGVPPQYCGTCEHNYECHKRAT